MATPAPRTAFAYALAMQQEGRLREAAGAFEALLAERPEDPALLHLLGRARGYLGDLPAAEALLRRCLEVAPDTAEAYGDLATFLRAQVRLQEAIDVARQGLAIDPTLNTLHSDLILTMENDPRYSQQDLLLERRAWARRYADDVPREPRSVTNRDPDRPLRVGYVSADFALHSAMFAIGPLLASHSDAVEVYCYSGVVDTAEDTMTAWLRSQVTAWRPAWSLDDGALAAQIRADEIDILVDLSGHTMGHRLTMFARHPAPIQITAWGYPTGTGMRQMDYLFGDPVTTPPEEEAYYAEEIVRLPAAIPYAPPEDCPPVRPAPRGFTFGILNSPRKLSPDWWAAVAAVARAVPKAKFLYQTSQWLPNHQIDALFRPLVEAGVTVDRIRALPPQGVAEHLGQLYCVDLNLDPFPYGGGITTLDCLHQGVPTLTLLGHGMPGRVSASIMQSVWLGELVTTDVDEYIQGAVDFYRFKNRMKMLRPTLRHRLYGTAWGNKTIYMAAVEGTYRQLWHRWLDEHPEGGTNGCNAHRRGDRGAAEGHSGLAGDARSRVGVLD